MNHKKHAEALAKADESTGGIDSRTTVNESSKTLANILDDMIAKNRAENDTTIQITDEVKKRMDELSAMLMQSMKK